MLPDAIAAIERTFERFRNLFDRFPSEIESFANFPSLFLGLTDESGKLEHYDGPLGSSQRPKAHFCAPAFLPNGIANTSANKPRTI